MNQTLYRKKLSRDNSNNSPIQPFQHQHVQSVELVTGKTVQQKADITFDRFLNRKSSRSKANI